MTNFQSFLFFIIATFTFGFAVWQIQLANHEQAHRDIFKYDDVNSTIKIGLFSGSVTPTTPITKDLTNLYAAQTIVEASMQIAIQQVMTNILLFMIFLALLSGVSKNGKS